MTANAVGGSSWTNGPPRRMGEQNKWYNVSGFWVSGGSAPGSGWGSRWRKVFAGDPEQKAQAWEWIDHRGHFQAMAIGSACEE